MNYLQAILLGGLQGVTELFPISSLGHSVLIPSLLGWHINQQDPYFLLFLVATHFATALVLLGFFYSDWVGIVRGIFRSLKNRRINPSDTYERLAWLLVVTTIPAGLLGLLFEDKLKVLFASPRIVALALIFNGLLLYGAEVVKKLRPVTEGAQGDEPIAALSWGKAVQVGLMQCLALVPGFSRTGATLGGGLLVGLDHERAARFAFLLATPIIFAASALKLPELIGAQQYPVGQIVAGAVASAICAYLSIRFLTRYFKSNTLTPFAIYCALAGVGASLVLLTR
jgi:undecaprenyl-diphosphatase